MVCVKTVQKRGSSVFNFLRYIIIIILEEYLGNIYKKLGRRTSMSKISLDMPDELLEDLKLHVGDSKKFVSVADAVRTACRKMLDQLDEIDQRHGRLGVSR